LGRVFFENFPPSLDRKRWGYKANYPCNSAVVRVAQIFSQSIWGAIYEPALLAFPNWTGRSLSLLPIWGSVMTAVFVFPACLTINKYGNKRKYVLPETIAAVQITTRVYRFRTESQPVMVVLFFHVGHGRAVFAYHVLVYVVSPRTRY